MRWALRYVVPCSIAGTFLSLGAPALPQPPARPDVRAAVEARVRALLDAQGDGAEAGIWVGGTSGPARYTRRADAVMPTASAIKTAYLVALFARFHDALDRPPPGLEEALAEGHPAMEPFTATQRSAIRKALAGATVRRLGRVMMGSDAADNAVYNAAASVVTAVLGGPGELTTTIHALDPAFGPIVARRYMLAPRAVRATTRPPPPRSPPSCNTWRPASSPESTPRPSRRSAGRSSCATITSG